MADVHSKEVRSFNMSRIRAKDTKPEMLVRKFLHANGFRFRLHVNNLPCKPDIVLPKYNTVIFVNGCFWHGHKDCKYFKYPKTRIEFWKNKIDGNKAKDTKALKEIRKSGWNVITIWECKLKANNTGKTLDDLLKKLA